MSDNPVPPVRQAIILAGGRGRRLGKLTDDTPKPLLPIGGSPFIDYVVRNLVRHGVTDIVLSIGYLGDALRDHLGDGARFGARISYAEEREPLGTGGGAKLAARGMSGPFFVLNGDTLLDCPYHRLPALVHERAAQAGLFTRHVEDAARYGAMEMSDGRITGFREKGVAGPGEINGGVYLLTPEALRSLPEGPRSLETDLFPALAREGRLVGIACRGFFLDMGLPETYAAAQTALPEWEASATRPQ